MDPADSMIDNYDNDVSTGNEGNTEFEDSLFLESGENGDTVDKNSLDIYRVSN